MKIRGDRESIEFICDVCGITSTKEKYEFERLKKKGRQNTCSRSCASVIGQIKRFGKEYGFYYYMKNIRKKSEMWEQDVEITPNFLYELWNKQEFKCPITGIEMKLNSTYKKKKITAASLDRIDSNKGYTKDNVRFIPMGLNYMKNDFNESDFLKFLELIKNSEPNYIKSGLVNKIEELIQI